MASSSSGLAFRRLFRRGRIESTGRLDVLIQAPHE